MLTWQFFLRYWATWTPEKKITLKKRSINGREEMASHNSYNYYLSECCIAQIAGYRMYLLVFLIKEHMATGLSGSHDSCVCCVTGHTTQSQWPWEMLHSFFFLHIFVMDLLLNKAKRTSQYLMLELFVPVPRAAGGAGAGSAPCSDCSWQNWCCGSILHCRPRRGMNLPWGFLFL